MLIARPDTPAHSSRAPVVAEAMPEVARLRKLRSPHHRDALIDSSDVRDEELAGLPSPALRGLFRDERAELRHSVAVREAKGHGHGGIMPCKARRLDLSTRLDDSRNPFLPHGAESLGSEA